jgi:hypothetical protein|tara:strand:- start:448 stop:615 length:168 start_codon:yes stop_codon:yes gene_type:complete
MEERFYNVVHQTTTGWEVVDRRLQKEQAALRLKQYLADGINPQDLRIDVNDDEQD